MYLGGWVRVISGVLNDSCSICYWVALLEISRGFNAESELRSWKAACGAAVEGGGLKEEQQPGPESDGAQLVPKCQADEKTLLTSIYRANFTTQGACTH